MENTLFVENSALGARWLLTESKLDSIERIVRKYTLPEIIARILVARNVREDQIQNFLKPTLKSCFPDPFAMKGMQSAAEDLAHAIENKKNFAIFADFDVDGATSSAIAYKFLKSVGIEATIYIPDRLSEGYGPNIDALKKIRDSGAEILLMLDCGTTAFEVVNAGTQLGLKIVILDHHETEENLPNAWHVINPKRKDDTANLSILAACGVTFLTCVAINNYLRKNNFYVNQNMEEPDLKAYMDLLALGTICDMVPLIGANRLFVKAGLTIQKDKLNTGIAALVEITNIELPLNVYHAGFILGPRINAGARVHKADLGAKLLCSQDVETAKQIAWLLQDCNEKRKEIQQQMEQEAYAMVEKNNLHKDAVILVESASWHPGLIGLVAGNLKEKYGKPACAIAYAYDLSGRKEGRGSGRSIKGVHIAKAFSDAKDSGILEKGGGHALAGGFTVFPEKIEELRKFLNDHVNKQKSHEHILTETSIDGVLSVHGVTLELASLLQNNIGPFGQENPEPVFVIPNAKLSSVDIMGKDHLRLLISDQENTKRIKALAFRSVGTSLGDLLMNSKYKNLHLACTIKINEWQGRQAPELHILDAAIPEIKENNNLFGRSVA